MKKSVFFVVILVFLFSQQIANAQSTNLTFKATIKTTENEAIPNVYLRIYLPDKTAAVDSMFSDENGIIERELPIAGPVSVFPIQTGQFISGKIYPNIVSQNSGTISLEYNYPSRGKLFFMDIPGKKYPNQTELPPGIYFYFLQFDDGNRSEYNKVVVSGKCHVSVNLNNIYGDGRLKHSFLQQPYNYDLFYAEFIKDGYVTQRDTILVDNNYIEKEYKLSAADVPEAAFSFSGSLKVGEPVLFDGSASYGSNGEDVVYSWDFGDKKRGQSETIPHLYNSPGDYDVTLSVFGDYGARKSVTKTISISSGVVAEEYTGIVHGYLVDGSQEPLADVTLSLVEEPLESDTDNSGIFEMSGLPLGIPLHFKIKKDGYVTQIITVTIPADTKEAQFFTTLKERNPSINLPNAEFGGEIPGTDGASIILPIEALVKEDGSIAKGDVSVSVTPVDVAFETESFPGTFGAVREDGEEGVILSYGVSEFSFMQDGEELQLAEGKKVKVLIPVYTGGARLGDQIPLWSVNEDNGKWVQEGTGIVVSSENSPTGLALQAEIGHLSWWNCDDYGRARKKDGLCWRWECTTARCYKVKVGCWMSGARRDTPTGYLKSLIMNSAYNEVRDEIPPVFEVRDFVPQTGKELIFPEDRDVYIEARSFNDKGELFTGSYTLMADEDVDTFKIELISVMAGDTTDIELNTLHEAYLEADQVSVFRVRIPQANLYSVFLSSYNDPALNGIYIVKDANNIIASDNITSDVEYAFSQPGQIFITVTGQNQTDEGYFKVGVFEPTPLALNDSISDSLRIYQNFRLFRLESDKNTALRFRFYKDELSSGSGIVQLLSLSGKEIESETLRTLPGLFTSALKKDSAQFISFRKGNNCEFTLITEEDQQYNIEYGYNAVSYLEYKNDIDLYNFEGKKDDVISIRGTQPDYKLNTGYFRFWNKHGMEITTREIRYYNTFNDDEIVYHIPEDGSYSIVVSSVQNDTGSYRISLDTISYRALNINTMTEIDVSPQEVLYFEIDLEEDIYGHFSILSESYKGGIYSLWNKKAESIAYYRTYSDIYNAQYSGRFAAGIYYVKIENDDASKLFINFVEAEKLDFNGKGKSEFVDDIQLKNKVSSFYFNGSPGDGIHGIMKKVEGESAPDKLEIRYFSLNNGTPLNAKRYAIDYYSLDSTILHESAKKLEGTDTDTSWLVVAYAQSPGSYDFNLHVVKESISIKVDDDFNQYPDAQTSSHIAAGYAISDGGELKIANGDYSSCLPLWVASDSVRVIGQEKENVKLTNVHNQSTNNPVIYLLSENGTIRNVSLSCGVRNYYAIEMYKEGSTIENIVITPMPGKVELAGGIKAGGDNVTIRDIFIDRSLWGITLGSTNGVIENCSLNTNSRAIEIVGENTQVRNNIINMLNYSARAISLTVNSQGESTQIIEQNQITTSSETYSGDAVINVSQYGVRGNTGTTMVRNNTIASSSLNAAFSLTTGNPSSNIIIENNKYNCTNVKGGKALILMAGRTDGSSGILVRNNIFNGLASVDAITVHGIDYMDNDQYFAICNNNFKMAPGAVKDTSKSFVQVYISSYSFGDTANLYFINNIFDANAYSSFIKCQDDFSVYSDYNIVYNFRKYISGKGVLIGTSNDIDKDPLYMDDDLNLGTGSPAINAGAPGTMYDFIPSLDINGVTRPQGEANDIGAYERDN